MAVGGFVDGPASNFHGKVTVSVVITCIVAASGGLMFGYDVGISGGVTTMIPFLLKFFPSVLRKAAGAHTNIYCMFDSQVLTAFTSSLYLAGLASSLVASRLTAAIGRKNTMLIGGFTFLAGSVINAAAANIAMLILGRMFLGFAVGFTNQATPMYLSEIAPAKWRGALNAGFQFFLGIGAVLANCINFAMAKHTWGWRVSLGMAIVPAAMMALGTIFIADTPSSLVERGKLEHAKKVLVRIRGKDTDIEPEFAELIKSCEVSKALQNEPFLTIFERKYRPQLTMAIAIPMFQQLTGIGVVAFYAPVLFQTVGFGHTEAFIASLILSVVNFGSTLASMGFVDRYGRRFLFIMGGIQMFACQVAITILLAVEGGSSGEKQISKGNAILVLVMMCIYTAGYGWSWGPLSWLITSEIFPLKIRTMGLSISVAVGFTVTFALSQTFLTLLCHFKYGTFAFYGGWVAIMTVFIMLLLPETKGIPLDSMNAVWRQHWYWNRFVEDE